MMKCALLVAGILPLAGCARQAAPVFTDVTDGSGIDFQYTYGDDTYENIIESSGSGITVFDYDGDGYLDVLLLNGTYLDGISDPEGRVYAGSTDRLYRNRGDGTFEDATERSGLIDRHWSMAASAADFDGDGLVDVYLLNYGPNVVFRNNGDGTFTDVTAAAGLAGPDSLNGFPKWSVGAQVWDYDGDGLLDVMVCNFLAFDPVVTAENGPHVMPHPAQYRGQASMLYRQESGGRFTDVTEHAGLFHPESRCMGLTVFDYDDDGHLDIFQANDHQSNFLFRNDGTGRFEEVAGLAGVAFNDDAVGAGSMHGTMGDVDGDGLIDLLVVDLEHGALYRNAGGGRFEDVTRASGAAAAFAGKGAWAAALFDVDNDGDLDIFSANGAAEELILQRPLLLENDGTGTFRDNGRAFGSYFDGERSGRGAVVWDFDNDGDLDILVSHLDGKPSATLLRNDGGNHNHWIGFSLLSHASDGARLRPAGTGARVEVHFGGRSQVAINQSATTYLSSNDPRLHFGLGDATGVDSVKIHWPDGNVQTLRDLDIDTYHDVIHPGGLGS